MRRKIDNPWVQLASRTLEDRKVAVALASLASLLLLHFFSDVGKTLLVILATYFISDIFFNFAIKGGQRVQAKAWFSDDKLPGGHSFLIFYVTIVSATLVAGIVVSSFITDVVTPRLGVWMNEAFISILFSLLVYWDLWLRFYRK